MVSIHVPQPQCLGDGLTDLVRSLPRHTVGRWLSWTENPCRVDAGYEL